MGEEKDIKSPFVHLNLPPADLRIRQSDRGIEVYDRLREKWLLLTPEEWVRQNFTSFLINHRGYSSNLMTNEISISLNGTSKRCDTVIYDHELKPLVLVEYKEPNIPITQKVFEQIARYNIVLRVRYLMVSNGLKHYCCEVDSLNNQFRFLTEIPEYIDIINN
ncbi:MAG: type I restriction enzyme HsdR N-terminal domain-containing protein [Duncaniella sp.]|nr:type I restriction enzyme HsdR N-terminal domain-containing protein [Muribaculum sp.]MCM1254516.1 type I restriction enzyme HsdR N-terminal domain-containing protein [Duncaniella sp.]